MIIATIQEVNAVNCCGCDFPVCDAPREQCESAAVTVCAFTPDADAPVVHPDSEEGAILYQSYAWTYYQYTVTSLDEITTNYSASFSYLTGSSASTSCSLTHSQTETTQEYEWWEEAKENLYVDRYNSSTSSGVWDGGSLVSRATQIDEIVYDIAGVIDTEFHDTGTATWYPELVAPAVGLSTPVWTGASLAYAYDDWSATVVFSDPYTFASAAAVANATELAPADYTGESCVSSLAVTLAADLVRLKAINTTRARYRRGVPAAYPGATWEMQWDEVSASTAWWAWYDGGMTGTEPTPAPVLENSRSWIWGGSLATEDAQFSDWYDLPVPATPGETRVVNTLTICYKSTRIGVKPTASGDQVAV